MTQHLCEHCYQEHTPCCPECPCRQYADGQPMITVYVSLLLDGQELEGYRRVGAVFEPYFDVTKDRMRVRPKSPIPMPDPDRPFNELGFFDKPKGGRLLTTTKDWEQEVGY